MREKKVDYEYDDFEEITHIIKDYADLIDESNYEFDEDDYDNDDNCIEEILDEKATEDLIETILHLMDEYVFHNPKDITEPGFHENLIENITDILSLQFEEELQKNVYFEDDINELIEEAADIFYTFNIPKRSHPDTVILNKNIDYKKIEEKINYLKSKPQPQQRTKEWYEFRHNLITASNAHKAFENQIVKNQLIFEKCQPLIKDEDIDKQQFVNTNSPLHWGQKYEPLSVMIYEKLYGTKVGDFGCIKHDKYHFLGASPDGINIDPTSERYGRMLEIKNIVNREIDGIPKKEYWIQMQLQMEVCDLDECDFLETKFTEYPDYKSYKEDLIDDTNKGVIIHFQKKDGRPFYVYKPLNSENQDDDEDEDVWEETQIDKYGSGEYGYTFIKYIYWKLEILSCVLVQRNTRWFDHNIKEMEQLWETVVNERITGHDHRASVKRQKKDVKPVDNNSVQESNCLINLDGETNKTIFINPQPTITQNPSVLDYFKKDKKEQTVPKQPLNIIKIDTETFTNTEEDDNK